MRKFTTNQKILQYLNPAQKQVYKVLFDNLNKNKADQELLTLSKIKNNVHYVLSTTADALQILRKLGLIIYSNTKRCWLIVTKFLKDNYDHYILTKWDQASKKHNEIVKQHGLYGYTQSNFQYLRSIL